jgi:glycosyltransferase involved in cell wall biosynthesis
MPGKKRCFGLNWQINMNSGWGVLGLNLAIEGEQRGDWLAIPFVPTIHLDFLPAKYRPLMDAIAARERETARVLNERPDSQCRCDFPVLHCLGNWLETENEHEVPQVVGATNFAIMFFEDTDLTDRSRNGSARFNRILAGSSWNAEVLKKNGISNVATLLQGVDLSIFRPMRSGDVPRQRFVVFSGGKLEYRKGQDIVVAAFRKFHRKHPEALLLTAWHNNWPKTITGIEHRGYVQGIPAMTPKGLDIVSWLEANGIPRDACHDIGAVPNYLMPDAYKQADAALLANRCEGGTNLVAMECLACGIPTILSANTGHLDLIDENHCYPLTRQETVQPLFPYRATAGWGESNVDEAVEKLEQIYLDRKEAQRRGAAAARFMNDWSWEKRFRELTEHFESFAASDRSA